MLTSLDGLRSRHSAATPAASHRRPRADRSDRLPPDLSGSRSCFLQRDHVELRSAAGARRGRPPPPHPPLSDSVKYNFLPSAENRGCRSLLGIERDLALPAHPPMESGRCPCYASGPPSSTRSTCRPATIQRPLIIAVLRRSQQARLLRARIVHVHLVIDGREGERFRIGRPAHGRF